MLKTNLRGQIRQTPLPKWKALLPLFEAVMNAFQAIQEARPALEHRIVIELERESELLPDESDAAIISFSVSDTGVGFNDANFDSFNTAFSEHKLDRGGKGLGRFMWLKAFDSVDVHSVFWEKDSPDHLWKRDFRFDVNYDPDMASAVPSTDAQTGTTVRLRGFCSPYKEECPRSTDVIAQRLVEHFILILLQKDCPKIEIRDRSSCISINNFFENHFRSSSAGNQFSLGGQEFSIRGFRLTAPRVSKHRLIYAANSRGVITENLDEYLPNLSSRLTGEDGTSFVYLAIVQSPYLNQKVNNYRTDFDIGQADAVESNQLGLLADEVRRSDIREKCMQYVNEDLSGVMKNLNEAKAERILQYVQSDAPQYKPLLKYRDSFIDRISPNASKMDMELALHRELHQREIELKREGSKIILEAAKIEDYESYRNRLSEFMMHSNELGVSALAQYVMHRKIILEFFDKAISASEKTGKYPLEQAVHNIIFPMRSTDQDTLYSQQNLWMIDERLTYHSFVASDMPLCSLDGHDNDSAKRPDLFIFDRKLAFADQDQEGSPINSVVVVEFKRPQKDNYNDSVNPLEQVIDQINTIRAGKFLNDKKRPIPVANDKIPASAYVICDITTSLRKILIDRDASATPDGLTYYGYHKNHGIYYEVIDYGKLLADAKRRNRIFFEKLNVMSR